MCKGNDGCNCCVGRDESPNTLELGIGKTYLDRKGVRVRIFDRFKDQFLGATIPYDQVRGYISNGLLKDRYPRHDSYMSGDLIREYKEPVIHKRDLVWYVFLGNGAVTCQTTEVGKPAFGYSGNDSYKEVKRETVTYTE